MTAPDQGATLNTTQNSFTTTADSTDAACLELARCLLRREAENRGHLRLAVRIAGLPCQQFSEGGQVLAGWGMQWRYEMSPAFPTEEDPYSARALTATARCANADFRVEVLTPIRESRR